MSLRSSQSELNLSNGFKKRLLRPVSTHKPNDPRNTMRSSAVLSLHDHISIKNKYGDAKSMLQTHCTLLTQNMDESIYKKKKSISSFESTLSSSKNPQSSQHLEKIIKKITQKKEKKQQYLQKTSHTSLNAQSKSMQTILKQIGAQNLQQGLKILYMQTYEVDQYLDECILLLCLCTENILGRTQQKNDELKINDGDENPVLMAKLLSFIISNLQNKDNINQQKFKPISILEDKQTQISTLKLQLQRQKQINIDLQEKLKALVNSQINTKTQTVSITDIQRVDKQIRKVYEQSSARKEEMIIKLKTEILQYQQKLAMKSANSDQLQSKNQMISDNENKEMGYALTIQEEFQKMRSGFVKKLQKAQSQSNEKQHNLKKQIFNFEKQIQNCQREKTILFKKYEFLLNNT